MKVQILQRGGNQEFNDVMKEAARFFASRLMSTRLANTLTVKIAFRVTGREVKASGHVMPSGAGSKGQRNFSINVMRDAELEKRLEVLAHEMVHVEQLASKRLQLRFWKTDSQCHVRWQGQECGVYSHIPYYSSPWEVEARAKASELMQKWFDKSFCLS
jgi:hypothetical protein